jgi:hypothetical protein
VLRARGDWRVGLDIETIWQTATRDVPALQGQLEALLNS